MDAEPEPITPRTHRRAILRVTDEMVYHIFLGIKSGKFDLPVFPDLPPDAELRGVHHDWQSGCFCIVLEHPSFAEVLEGCPSPWLEVRATEFRTVAEAVEPTAVVMEGEQ